MMLVMLGPRTVWLIKKYSEAGIVMRWPYFVLLAGSLTTRILWLYLKAKLVRKT